MRYRVRQFFQALFARVSPDERALVQSGLLPAQAALFGRMSRSDQRHGLDVYRTLCDAGHEDAALLQAALLHDVGKTASGLSIWHRVAVVLLERLAPGWLARLAADGQGWRAPFALHARHPQVGARRAAEAGCAPEAVALIRRHHEPAGKDENLAALQWADRQN